MTRCAVWKNKGAAAKTDCGVIRASWGERGIYYPASSWLAWLSKLTWWLSSSPVDQRTRRPSSLQLPSVFASQRSVEHRDGVIEFIVILAVWGQVTCKMLQTFSRFLTSAPVASILYVTYLACKTVIVMGYTPTVAKVIFLQTLASDMELI